jgi:hypothetical protein
VYPWVADPGGGDSSVLRWPSQWRTAAYAGLRAGAGILAWYALHVGWNPDESWRKVVLAFALGATLSSFFVEPLVQRLVHRSDGDDPARDHRDGAAPRPRGRAARPGRVGRDVRGARFRRGAGGRYWVACETPRGEPIRTELRIQ